MSTKLVIIPKQTYENAFYTATVGAKVLLFKKKYEAALAAGIKPGAMVLGADEIIDNFIQNKRNIQETEIELTLDTLKEVAYLKVIYEISTYMHKNPAEANTKRKILAALCDTQIAEASLENHLNTIQSYGPGTVDVKQVETIRGLMLASTKMLSYCIMNFKRGKLFEVYENAMTEQLARMSVKMMTLEAEIAAKKDVAANMSSLEKMERRARFLKGDAEQRMQYERELSTLWPTAIKKSFKIVEQALSNINTSDKFGALKSPEAEMWCGNGRICTLSGYALGVLLDSGLDFDSTGGYLVPHNDIVFIWRQLNNDQRIKLAAFVVTKSAEIKAARNNVLEKLVTDGKITEQACFWWCACALWQGKRNATLKVTQRTTVSKVMKYNEVVAGITATNAFKF